MKTMSAFVLGAVLVACSGCASVTGLVTGAFTGAVDLPAETYRQNVTAFNDNPMLYGVDALVVGPCGIAVGPLAGLCKGAALDVEWVCGKVGYDKAFGTYNETSIWRPCTIKWSGAPKVAKMSAPVPEIVPNAPAQTTPPPVAPESAAPPAGK